MIKPVYILKSYGLLILILNIVHIYMNSNITENCHTNSNFYGSGLEIYIQKAKPCFPTSMNSGCFQITFQEIISNYLCSQNYLVFLHVTQCLCLSSLCMYAPVTIKHTDIQTRERERQT